MMMKRFALTLLAALFAGDAMAAGKGQQREEPIVASGLTISSYLDAGSNNTNDDTFALTNAFSTTSGSATVTVHRTGHGLAVNDYFSLYQSTVVGGLSMDGGWKVASVPDANSFTFTHTNLASSTVATTGSTTYTNATIDLDGKLRFLCKFSHLSYDDPILFPGRPGATHLHLFFGHRGANYASTYASLRASGDGTCEGGPLNRTAYWMPAMIDTSLNQVRIPISFQWYYAQERKYLVDRRSSLCQLAPANWFLQDGRAINCIGPTTYAMKRIERGMRAIYGFKVSAGGYPSTYVGPGADILAGAYTCQTTGGIPATANSFRYLHHRTTPSLGLSSDSGCPSSGIVSLRTGNPMCWNGSHTGTDGYDHFAPAGNDGDQGFMCPATHPYAFLQFTVIATWSYTGGISTLSNWQLSSDRFNGADFEAGETFHWDMFWAWEDAVQDHFHKYINGMFPNPASDSPGGGPYLFSRTGLPPTFGGPKAENEKWTGGPFLRNTANGGLSGNAGIGDCTPLGMAGPCSLTQTYPGAADILVPIPTAPLGTYTLP